MKGVWTLRCSMKDLEPLSNTLQTQWWALELCNRVDMGLYNVPVQVSKRSCMGSGTAGWTRPSSGQLPAAPCSLHAGHTPHHCLQGPANNPSTIFQSQTHRPLTLPPSHQSERSPSAEGSSPREARSQARPVQSFRLTSWLPGAWESKGSKGRRQDLSVSLMECPTPGKKS